MAAVRGLARIIPRRLAQFRPAPGRSGARATSAFRRHVGRGLSSRSVPTRAAEPAPAAVHATSIDSEWTEAWTAATSELRSEVTFDESADRLRALIRSGLLSFSALRDNPARFFEAHRILARHAVEHGPGFWIRFTVQYNLFAGTILAAGNDEQIALLHGMQAAGELGCFALTEQLAGVQSGLIVQTEARHDPESGGFVLQTPSPGARKNWISQGATADKAVVVANLKTADGEAHGPHAFVMDFRTPGEGVVPGIELADMGPKTTGNDLDNAWLHFHNVKLPGSALLSRYAKVGSDGTYHRADAGVAPFDMIGQRLYSGRVAVAQAALEYRKGLFAATAAYSDSKPCWSPGGEIELSRIPQLRAIYAEEQAKAARLGEFLGRCEAELNRCLAKSDPPSASLGLAIATAKVRAVEESIELCFRLKQEVGSFALMQDAGFRHMDFLQCCKFAEGDSRILMQKMARDRLKQFADDSGASFSDDEAYLCTKLAVATRAEVEKTGGSKQAAWDANWRLVYSLAEAVMDRVEDEMLA